MIRATHQRRLTELHAKLASLRFELESWKTLTETSPSLKRHHSQIRLLDVTLSGLLEPVSQALAAQAEDATVLNRGLDWEREILAAHSIWEVFRAKYVLRQNETFGRYLAACDDLAWECYSPALQAFAPGALKEPPLVYLSATWSPFAQSRDTNFQNEIRVTNGGAVLASDEFQDVLKSLPIPLVSLPWYQLKHLPGAIIVAHEVGHIVERDFDLHDDLLANIEGANLSAPRMWKGWASEVFADVYGCLAMGPAFAGALLDLLSTAANVVGERRVGGPHPTHALRAELTLGLLGETGFKAQADRLRAAWEATYGQPVFMKEFVDDARKLGIRVAEGSYRGKKLREVIGFPPNAKIEFIANAAAGNPGALSAFPDPRLLFSAAQYLHEETIAGDITDAFDALVDQALRRGADQYRSEGEPILTKADLDAALEKREEQAAKAVPDLRKLLNRLTSAGPARANQPPDS